jgi:cellulose synthase (UDP-forming)
MATYINKQRWYHLAFYSMFGVVSAVLMLYYLSDTLIHFTTNQQFPVNSFKRFPLTLVIFPAEVFSFIFGMYFVYALFNDRHKNKRPAPLPNRSKGMVAILVPVYNEPKSIVNRTLSACNKVKWIGKTKVYLLDDSTNESDKKNMGKLAKKYHCSLIRRDDRKGYKAGNINNAVKNYVKEKFFVILDSDQAPEPEFLNETMDYFSDRRVSFVQTPQHFVNDNSLLQRAAKVGTNIFYHSQCASKAKDGAMPFCGTNAVIRKEAFDIVNGFSYYTSTEDIELGIRMNEAGYHGVYEPQLLVHGFSPPDFKAYSSQQYRWSNGNLAILRENWHRLLFGKFSLRHQVHTFFTLGWWLIGITTLAYIIVPMVSMIVGGTHHTWLPTPLLLLLFTNVFLGIGMIFASLNGRTKGDDVSFADALLQYSLITNSMFIYTRAALNAMLKRYVGFVRTSKTESESGIMQVKWNLMLSAVCFGFGTFALFKVATASESLQVRSYLPISLWLLFYSVILASSILFVGKNPETQSNQQNKLKGAPA